MVKHLPPILSDALSQAKAAVDQFDLEISQIPTSPDNKFLLKRAELRAYGVNLRAWCRERNLPYYTVRDVLHGKSKAVRGKAHQAAVALGLKPDPATLKIAA